MKDELRRDLSRPYHKTGESRADELAGRLGLCVREQRQLTKALHQSLDPAHKGFRCLHAMDFRRRILISDTTYAASASVGTNLLDAALHLREIEASATVSQERWASRLQPQGGHPLKIAPSPAPLDDVVDHMIELQSAGFFRAAASVLDCLGIVSIGVLGLPTPLLKGDWRSVKHVDRSGFARGPTREERIQRRSLTSIGRFARRAGPPDWDAWTADVRHMYVHRPRRLTPRQLTPTPLAVLHSSGNPFLRTEVDLLLPREAGRCDPDVMADVGPAEQLVLSEPLLTTVAGVLRSVNTLCERVCRMLRRVWRLREAGRLLIEQPKVQWSQQHSNPTPRFSGYDPGSLHVQAGGFFAEPDAVTRLKAAAVLDGDRHLWEQNPWVP